MENKIHNNLSKKILTINNKSINNKVSESYKTLRTNLLYTVDLKVIAIVSSAADESKTVSAFNLAQSLAEINKKVLLIDGDLRRSALHKYMRVSENLPGLSEMLLGLGEDYVYTTNIENLSILLAGAKTPNPLDLLSSKKFEEMLQKYKKEYDYVIIDTPPVEAASDALIISRIADGSVLVIRNEYTSRKNLIRTKTQLLRNDARIVGVVLTRVKKRQLDYYYYDYGYNKE